MLPVRGAGERPLRLSDGPSRRGAALTGEHQAGTHAHHQHGPRLRPIAKARQSLPELGQPRRSPRFHAVVPRLPTPRRKAGAGASTLRRHPPLLRRAGIHADIASEPRSVRGVTAVGVRHARFPDDQVTLAGQAPPQPHSRPPGVTRTVLHPPGLAPASTRQESGRASARTESRRRLPGCPAGQPRPESNGGSCHAGCDPSGDSGGFSVSRHGGVNRQRSSVTSSAGVPQSADQTPCSAGCWRMSHCA
jgi:hypothetical protein